MGKRRGDAYFRLLGLRSVCSMDCATWSSISLISNARRVSCGFFKYAANSRFLLVVSALRLVRSSATTDSGIKLNLHNDYTLITRRTGAPSWVKFAGAFNGYPFTVR